MSNSMADSIDARMADWSLNYLSTEYCVLSPGSVLRVAFPILERFSSPLRGEAALHLRIVTSFDINPETGCWEWTKAIDAGGYGRQTVDRKSRMAHRVMLWVLNRDVPEGMVVDHLCRVRRCVNPEHLEVVSHYENDMRGESAWAVNARKTHCLRGHEFTEENTGRNVIKGRQVRYCKTCRRELDKARHARNAERPEAAMR